MINWYKIAKDLSKVAQIWIIDHEEDGEDFDGDFGELNFGGKIKEMYELEYKWSMMRTRPFKGLPQRQENMLLKLESALVSVTEEIQEQLITTIGTWLNKHALLSPKTWAEGRASDEDSMEDSSLLGMFNNMIWEYNKYSTGNSTLSYGQTFSSMLDDALSNIESYPELGKYIDWSFLEEYKEWQKANALEDVEEFNSSHGTQFTDEEDIENWIDVNTSVEDLDVSFIFSELESFVNGMVNGALILEEFYANQVFPLWHRYWSTQGIEETRETIEEIFEELKSANSSNVGNLIAAVNAGLNASHQTGDMLEYLESDTGSDGLRKILDAMSEGDFVERVDKELRMVGVQI